MHSSYVCVGAVNAIVPSLSDLDGGRAKIHKQRRRVDLFESGQ